MQFTKALFCSEQLITKLLLLYLVLLSSAADIPAVPNSWLQTYFFFSTWSCRPWLQIFQLFRTADSKVTSSSLPVLAVLGCRYSSCSEQLITKLLLLLYLVLPSLAADIPAVPNSRFQSYFFSSTWSWRPWLQIFQLFRTADWKATSRLSGLALLNYRYSSCSEQLIARLLILLYLVLPSLAAEYSSCSEQLIKGLPGLGVLGSLLTGVRPVHRIVLVGGRGEGGVFNTA